MAATLDTDYSPTLGIWSNVPFINLSLLGNLAEAMDIKPASSTSDDKEAISYFSRKIERLHEKCMQQFIENHKKYIEQKKKEGNTRINDNRIIYLPHGNYPMLTNAMLEAISPDPSAVLIIMGKSRHFNVVFPDAFDHFPNLIAFTDQSQFNVLNRTFQLENTTDEKKSSAFPIVKINSDIILTPQTTGTEYLYFNDDNPFSNVAADEKPQERDFLATRLDTDYSATFDIWGGFDTSPNAETIREHRVMLNTLAKVLGIKDASDYKNDIDVIYYYYREIKKIHESCLPIFKKRHIDHIKKVEKDNEFHDPRILKLPHGNYPILTNAMLKAISPNPEAVFLIRGIKKRFKVIFPNIFAHFPNLIAFTDQSQFNSERRLYEDIYYENKFVKVHITKILGDIILAPQKTGPEYLFLTNGTPFSPELAEQILHEGMYPEKVDDKELCDENAPSADDENPIAVIDCSNSNISGSSEQDPNSDNLSDENAHFGDSVSDSHESAFLSDLSNSTFQGAHIRFPTGDSLISADLTEENQPTSSANHEAAPPAYLEVESPPAYQE